jgi:hypothetical protein
MAIGGSITLITQARPRNTPCQMKPVSHHGEPIDVNHAAAASSTANSIVASMADGTLAPMMVNQNTTARMPSISGSPKSRDVTMRSIFWSSSSGREPASRTARRATRSTSPYNDVTTSSRKPVWSERRSAPASRMMSAGLSAACSFISRSLRGVGGSLSALQGNLAAEPLVRRLLLRDQLRQAAAGQRLFNR